MQQSICRDRKWCKYRKEDLKGRPIYYTYIKMESQKEIGIIVILHRKRISADKKKSLENGYIKDGY